jgi:hypothetical protein
VTCRGRHVKHARRFGRAPRRLGRADHARPSRCVRRVRPVAPSRGPATSGRWVCAVRGSGRAEPRTRHVSGRSRHRRIFDERDGPIAGQAVQPVGRSPEIPDLPPMAVAGTGSDEELLGPANGKSPVPASSAASGIRQPAARACQSGDIGQPAARASPSGDIGHPAARACQSGGIGQPAARACQSGGIGNTLPWGRSKPAPHVESGCTGRVEAGEAGSNHARA